MTDPNAPDGPRSGPGPTDPQTDQNVTATAEPTTEPAAKPAEPAATPSADPTAAPPGEPALAAAAGALEPDEDPGGKAGKKGKKKGKKKGGDGKLGSQRGIETMFRTSYRTHLDLSQMADNKANIMISINGIIISVVIASVSPKIDANPWLLVPTTVLLVGCVISLVYAILSARPRVTSHVVTLDDVKSNRANVLFFGNFVNMEESDYLEGMTALIEDSDRLYTNMMRDIYSLGGVLKRKYKLLRTAYTMFMISLVVSVLLFIAVFVAVTPSDSLLG